MSDLHYEDDDLKRILRDVKTIAMIGASANWARPSNLVMRYLQGKGYRVIPVNPGQAGREILGETCYAALSDIPGKVDMVDIFRNSDAAGQITDEAIACKEDKGISVVWMQLGIRNDDAAARAEAAGLEVVMNRCPKIEYDRLFDELSWNGVNTEINSSKRARLSP